MTSLGRLSFILFAVAACAAPTAPGKLVQLEVSEHIGLCLGNFRAGCINVRLLPDGAWRPAEVRGLRYREGTRYRLWAAVSADAPGSPHLVQEVYVVRRVLSEYRVPPA